MSPRKSKLDTLDYQIIQELHANARISASQVERKTGSNEPIICKRIEHLIEDEVISLTAILDLEAYRYMTTVDIFLDADLALSTWC
jgi:DNA-binding Lrp family transcriptional regulator